MTTLRPSFARTLKRRTKPSARTAQHTIQRDGRQHNSSSPSSLKPGSDKFETPRLFTLRLPRRNSYHISKRGERANTPLTSWRYIMKFSAITSRLRAPPSILICSRMPRGKPAEHGEQLPLKLYSISPLRKCSQQSNFLALTKIGKSARNETRPIWNRSWPTRRPMIKQE